MRTLGFAAVGILWLAADHRFDLASCLDSAKHRAVVRLAGFKWTRADFCRGWLITGDTGSGKTRSGITPLLFQVFRNEPTWGGLCIDDKGIYWETLSEMARHFGREDDLILLQVRPEDAGLHWQPKHTYNLTSDRSIPYNTFAKAVVDTAGSLGQAGDKGFFKSQAQIHIAAALETLREIGADVTLENAYHLLLDQGDLDEAMTDLASSHQTARRRELSEHFANRFLSQPPGTDRRRERNNRQLSAGFHHARHRAGLLSRRQTPSISPTSTAAKSSAWRCRRSSSWSAVT